MPTQTSLPRLSNVALISFVQSHFSILPKSMFMNVNCNYFLLAFLFGICSLYTYASPIEGSSKRTEYWMDTLHLYYPQSVRLDTSYSKTQVTILCNTLDINHLEDIAQYIRKSTFNLYLKSNIYWHNELLFDARRKVVDMDTISNLIVNTLKTRGGYNVILTHTKFDVNYFFSFGSIKNVSALPTTNNEYTISGVSNTTYQRINYQIKTGKFDCNKINQLLSYTNKYYSTNISSIGEIPGLYDRNYIASKNLDPVDCSTYFTFGLMSKDLNKIDLRKTEKEIVNLHNAAPIIIVAGALFGLKKLWDATAGSVDYGSNAHRVSYNTPSNEKKEAEYTMVDWVKTTSFDSGSVDPERTSIKFKCPNNISYTEYIGRNLSYGKIYSTGTNVCGFGHKRFEKLEEVVSATIDCKCNNK